jgi:hypothetical protein
MQHRVPDQQGQRRLRIEGRQQRVVRIGRILDRPQAGTHVPDARTGKQGRQFVAAGLRDPGYRRNELLAQRGLAEQGRQVEQPAPQVLAHHFLLDRGIEPGRARLAACGRQRQFGGTPLGLAAECEQQGHQPHRFVGRPAVQAAGHGRPLAGDTDGADHPTLDGEADPHAARIETGRHAGASGRRSVNRAPPLGWFPAVSLPPWRSTMP